MKRTALTILSALLILLLAGCGAQPKEFTVKVKCQSEGIYQLFYTCYIGEKSCGMGGMADLEGGMLTEKTDLSVTFTEEYLEHKDISAFSMDFSPYGKNDTAELATTARVSIDAEYGKTYTIIFSGDQESGFSAKLQE